MMAYAREVPGGGPGCCAWKTSHRIRGMGLVTPWGLETEFNQLPMI